jgi:hypothetical protein
MELQQYITEAAGEVEKSLAFENYSTFGTNNNSELAMQARIRYTNSSRYLYNFDPLAKQSIRLWTDYTFGSGISWNTEDKTIKGVLDKFWNDPDNRTVLSAKGQRKSSDKALVDGEVFFALFLGPSGEVTIRWVDPLEVTEIISDPDDAENVLYYKRQIAGSGKPMFYRSHTNIDDIGANQGGSPINATEDALIYHLAINSIGQRGNPLLLPAIGWIEQYRLFLAARIAIVRALARFAWAAKTKGGSSAVGAVKAAVDGKFPQAGSTLVTNEALSMDPIKTDTGSANASEDGRMLKLQICSAVGISEQYYGDIATGNLATAKTVELPMLKQFGSYQQVWADVYLDIFNIVLDYNDVSPDDRFVDFDMPPIAPEDGALAMTAITQLVTAFPGMADSKDVMTQALMAIGVNNTDEVLENLGQIAKDNQAKADAIATNTPPTPPNGQPEASGDNQPPMMPPAKESAEVRAIKALVEIRDGLKANEG